MTEAEAEFDALEDALAAGFAVDTEDRVKMDDLWPLMNAARAVLMRHRGVDASVLGGQANAGR